MSAPGIQLNSQPNPTYFPPSIRQYLQSIQEALTSNNLPAAQQAVAQLTKAIPSLSQGSAGQANELTARVSQRLEVVGRTMEMGDLSGAATEVANLRRDLQSASSAEAHQQQIAPVEPASSNGAEDSSSDLGPNLNVTA